MRVIFASLLLAVACGSSQEKPASTPRPEPQTESSSAPPAEPQAEPLKTVEIGEPRKDGTCPSTSVLRGGKCVIEGTEMIVLELVPFEENSSEIGPKAATIIGNVAEILKKHPEFSKLEIAGHARPGIETDAPGLSRARAERVARGLVERGVDKARLLVAAYADYCPVKAAPAPDPEGRNGGIQFKVIEVVPDGATGVRRGCRAATAAGVPAAEPLR